MRNNAALYGTVRRGVVGSSSLGSMTPSMTTMSSMAVEGYVQTLEPQPQPLGGILLQSQIQQQQLQHYHHHSEHQQQTLQLGNVVVGADIDIGGWCPAKHTPIRTQPVVPTPTPTQPPQLQPPQIGFASSSTTPLTSNNQQQQQQQSQIQPSSIQTQQQHTTLSNTTPGGDQSPQSQQQLPATPPPSSCSSSLAGSSKARGSQVCCVYLLNRTCLALQVESLSLITAGQILQQVADAPCEPGLGQDACLAFALWIANADFELQLEPGRAPLDVYKAWTALVQVYCKLPAPIVGEPKLILQRNVTLNEEEERRICQRNPAVLELLYHEARCNVLDGRYPVTEHIALRLAAFQAAIELDGQSACDVLASTDKAAHFLPSKHLRKRARVFGQSVEKKLVQEYRDLLICRSTDKASLMRDYLDVCRKLVFYGSAFFQGSLDSFFGSREVTVAINRRGLHMLTKDGRLEASYLFSVNQYPPLFSWDYGKPVQEGLEPCLYVTDGYLSSHQVFSKQAFLMDKMLMMLQPSKL
ncbi:putative FERM domain-containing protein FRMD8P1 isoform X2 [Varroa destructor]|nr:putative FERM domain-containing protein FRMD8P1 isoform X2 [Varroa destructor]XP_022654646.1 putative FERM domain-containing protein FRMD8P1 isoform X2 [Varroa destructor]XP_022654647.1 putative FERM domain-containing protein FRMD8P1 isoform X2 [Varroa destructor]XP_022654648.1 putative FERM domain-containing protein FRMD8P1 isoform X2 [Varroa destructor]